MKLQEEEKLGIVLRKLLSYLNSLKTLDLNKMAMETEEDMVVVATEEEAEAVITETMAEDMGVEEAVDGEAEVAEVVDTIEDDFLLYLN